MRRLLTLIVAATLAVASCTSGDQLSQELDGREFTAPGIVPDTNFVISFDGERMSARAGCNSIGGTYEIDDGRLLGQELSQTAMGCDPARHDQDAFLDDLLTSRPMVELNGMSLVLTSQTASLDMIDTSVTNPNRALIGTTWELDTIIHGPTAQAFADVDRAELQIIGGQVMSVFDGCVRFRHAVEVTNGELLYEALDMPPAPGCNAPDGYRDGFYAAYRIGKLSYTVDGDSLELLTAGGTGLVLKAT